MFGLLATCLVHVERALKKIANDMSRGVTPRIVEHAKAAMPARQEDVFREQLEAIRQLSPF